MCNKKVFNFTESGDKMSEKLACDRHDEQIKTLFRKQEDSERRIECIEGKVDNMQTDDITDIKVAINTISLSMEHMVESDKRRDRLDERRDELNENQNRTLEKINQNLNELNEGQRKLNKKVDTLEERVNDNESKHSIDLRDIEKKKYTDIIFKLVLPVGGAMAILWKLLEILK